MNKELIRESFEALKPYANEAVAYFYETLFKLHPRIQPLFGKVNLIEQQGKLLAAISHGVEYLDEMEHLKDYYRKLGIRHDSYGAQTFHYNWVGEALLETLSYFFGENWSKDAESSWTQWYQFVSASMKQGLKEAQAKKEKETSIIDIAREQAKAIFLKALEEELQGSLRDLAQEKAKEILKRSLEAEARRELSNVRSLRKNIL